MTATSSKFFERIVWGALFLVIIAIVVAFVLSKINAPAPLPVYSQLSDFSMRDQNGQTVTLESLRGKVCLADVIFTSCPGQCLRMTEHMKQLQAQMPKDLPVQFLSFTTDPAHDTPPVLKKHIARLGLSEDRWLFLTADKAMLKQVAIDGLKLAVMDKPESERDNINDLFIHSAKFVLIDQHGQVRAFFDGEEMTNNAAIIDAVRVVLHEK